jgi:phosphoribosylformimino-5-aminoimidazole carboxamide ribotide isomerase
MKMRFQRGFELFSVNKNSEVLFTMRIRPCIDLHEGRVKQIVGSSLRDDGKAEENFTASESPSYFAGMYRRDGLSGGHVILLGPGNEIAAREALRAFPGGLQVGGGVRPDNATDWLDAGAAKVIVTSYLFEKGRFSLDRLRALGDVVGQTRLVVDLSCVKVGDEYRVAANHWQTVTEQAVDRVAFAELARFADEFLVHAVDVEGKRQGIDEALVELLGAECPVSVTYAGGIRSLADLELVERLGRGRVDATVGSALDIFGGSLAYRDVVEFDRARR